MIKTILIGFTFSVLILLCPKNEVHAALSAKLHSPVNNKTLELTVLSQERALEVFQTLKNDEDNTFDAPLNACFGRAHRMAIVMDEMEIISGKAFIEGDLYIDTKLGEIGWTYHVSSVVMVKKNKTITPMIIDPTFFKGPVSVEEWKKKFTSNPKSKINSIYYNNRFSYDTRDKDSDLWQYDEEQIEDSKQQIKDNRRKVEMIEYMENK